MRWLPFVVSTLLLFQASGQENRITDEIRKKMTNIKAGRGEEVNLRDPFKRNMPKKARGKKKYGKGSTFSNSPSLQDVPLQSIRIVGVLLGKERRALAKIGDADANSSEGSKSSAKEDIYTIREGMKLGVNSGEVKAILPGGIVVVEKLRNVYEQDEYLETIIPLSE